MVTTEDDITDNNEEVFGVDDIGDMFGNTVVEEVIPETQNDFQFDFVDDVFPTNTIPEETRDIRHWVSRTINPQPVDYTINTTLRNGLDRGPDGLWDRE